MVGQIACGHGLGADRFQVTGQELDDLVVGDGTPSVFGLGSKAEPSPRRADYKLSPKASPASSALHCASGSDNVSVSGSTRMVQLAETGSPHEV